MTGTLIITCRHPVRKYYVSTFLLTCKSPLFKDSVRNPYIDKRQNPSHCDSRLSHEHSASMHTWANCKACIVNEFAKFASKHIINRFFSELYHRKNYHSAALNACVVQAIVLPTNTISGSLYWLCQQINVF